MFGLRLGDAPQAIVTTTPKPTLLLRNLTKDPLTFVTRGSTFDNKANLADAFIGQILSKYEGTRLGRQEIDGEVLDDYAGALWSRGNLDKNRVSAAPSLKRIVVAIDPAATATEESDETGLVVAGVGQDGRGYVLEDRSGRYPPDGWAREAIALYKHWGADRIVAEVNNGGDMVEATIRMVDRTVSYKSVRASRGKVIRAEPVAALYEQDKVSHIQTGLAALEDQMCQFSADFDRKAAGYSPDRVDALVWALTELMVEPSGEPAHSVNLPFMAR
jgi:phage terminase large subunit-like protein